MSMHRKPWMTLQGNIAKCGLCQGVSQWRPYRMSLDGRTLTFWKWWRRFKQQHAGCACRGVVTIP